MIDSYPLDYTLKNAGIKLAIPPRLFLPLQVVAGAADKASY